MPPLASSLLIVVPARGGSKRLPGKNTRVLGGRPLIAHTAEAINESGVDAPVVLTTDDAKIAEVGRGLGWLVPFLRPPELADDIVSTPPAVLHALDWYSAESGGDPDLVMVLQPTSPLRGGETIHRALSLADERQDIDSVVGMCELPHGAHHVYCTGEDGIIVPQASAGGRIQALVPNGAMYLVRTPVLRAHASLYPPRTLPLIMAAEASADIDTELDWLWAEAILELRERTAANV